MTVKANEVFNVLRKSILVDGFDIVIDMEKSEGSYIIDARDGRKFLDFYTFFASSPLGMNHPKLANEKFKERVFRSAVNKIANSDIYTIEFAEWVDAVKNIAMPDYLPHLFQISGGALAVESALKVAFDWKVKKNLRNLKKEPDVIKGQKVLHFDHAFHGRTGYTMSLTHTVDPRKYQFFPKFDWPRINPPVVKFPIEQNLAEIEKAEEKALNDIYSILEKDHEDIAAFIMEPVQGEGGDNFFRKEFFQALRKICDNYDILLIFDEVQSGMGITGKWWAHQHFDVKPDIMAFGKKMQICGIMAGKRIDEVENNAFVESSRINSTFGGNIVDMVRATRILEIIKEDNLIENARIKGEKLKKILQDIQKDFPVLVFNTRGLGLMCSFDLPDIKIRNEFQKRCFEENMLILPCGKKSIRFRPILCIEDRELELADEKIRFVLKKMR
ncbi:MAG: L-lysine 6-transaminase [Atribacterota bacterium]|nr:L-lysine 6-transaminase [Atribacterota bacterium]